MVGFVKCRVLSFCLALLNFDVDGFSVSSNNHGAQSSHLLQLMLKPPLHQQHPSFVDSSRPKLQLWMESESSTSSSDAETGEAGSTTETAAETTKAGGEASPLSAEDEGLSVAEPPQPTPEESPELKALKEEIASLESSVKSKRRVLAGLEDKAEEYTKTGYARKVAEMENMRRARKMLQNSNTEGAVASTLVQFLPVYDRLEQLNEELKEDPFGKQFGALLISMKQAYTNLGVTDFIPAQGEAFDAFRMVAVPESVETLGGTETTPTGVVQQTIRPGLELKGNVVRAAQVMVSSTSSSTTEAS